MGPDNYGSAPPSLTSSAIVRSTSAVPEVVGESPPGKFRSIVAGLGSDTIVTLAANGGLGLISLVTGPLLARLLGVVGRGEIAAIQILAMPLSTLAMLGQMEATVYYSARDPEGTGRYVGTASLVALCGAAVFTLVGFLALPALLHRQAASVVQTARWYLLLIPLYALIYVPLQGLRAAHMRLWNLCRVLPNVAWLLAVAGAALLGMRYSAAVAAGHLLALGLVAPIILWAVRKRVRGSLRPSKQALPAMLRFGIPSSAGTMSQWLNFRVDQLLMVLLLPASGVGLYSVASGWSAALLPLFTALAYVALPRVAAGRSESDRVMRFGTSVRRATAAGIAIIILAVPITPIAVPLLFGNSFNPAVVPTMILMVGMAVAGINLVVEDGLRGLGSPTAVFIAETAGWVATALCVWASIGRYGLIGLAASSVAGYFLTLSILALFTYRKTKVSLWQTFVPTGSDLRVLTRLETVFKS